MKIHKSLNFKICFYFFISNLILVLFLGGIFYFSASNILIKKSISTATESIEKSGNYIELYTKKLTTLSEVISNDRAVYKYLKEKSDDEKDRILNMIMTVLSTDKYIKSVILIRKDGSVISNEKNVNMETSSNMMKEKWYVDSLKNHMPVLNPLRKQKFTKDNMEHWVISVSKEIHDETGNNLGVLLIDIKYQVLNEFLQNSELVKGGDAIILNENNQVVYYKDISCIEEGKQCLAKFLNLKEGYNSSKNTFMMKYPIKNTNWFLVSVFSLKEVESLKFHFFDIIFVSCLISLMITFVMSTFILNKIAMPIKELEKHMRNFSSNLSKVNLKGDIAIEILSLQNHFNDMIDRIKYLREYEINALHSQINPHFLYNTLDTIIWMAEFQDTEKVISITKALANFFRISLSNGKEKISLKDEIKHSEEYLYIQKERYEDKLEYNIDVLLELEDIEVPKIILQPIIENAIYHGIKNLDGKGIVKIYTKIIENKIQIIIEDNGIGFKEAKKQKLSKTGGVGIKNVNKRIQFYYGEEYGVFIDKEVEKGARIIISLPYLKNKH